MRAPREEDAALPAFAEPEKAPGVPVTVVKPGHFRRTIERDLVSGEIASRLSCEGGFFGVAGTYVVDPIGLEIAHTLDRCYTIHDDDPLCASASFDQSIGLARGDWRVRIDVRTRQWSTAGHIHHEAEVDAWFGEEKVSARRWSEKFVRKLL